jgi:hypothetical protein
LPLTVIFLAPMLREEKNHPGRAILTTTERAFAQATPYDAVYQALDRPVGLTLHYLDLDEEALITLRDLHCVHVPQIFAGKKQRSLINQVIVHPQTGALSHPGEAEELEKLQNILRRRRGKIERAHAALGRVLDKMLPNPDGLQASEKPAGIHIASARLNIPRADGLMRERAVCQFCGQETEDWWYLDRKTGLCKCRACLHRGLS